MERKSRKGSFVGVLPTSLQESKPEKKETKNKKREDSRNSISIQKKSYRSSTSSLHMESYIVKQGGSVKSWKERYLVNEPQQLSYYVSSDKKKKKGSIDVKIIERAEFFGDHDGKNNVFCIFTEKFGNQDCGRTYFISTANQRLSMEWVNIIQQIKRNSVFGKIEELKESPEEIKIQPPQQQNQSLHVMVGKHDTNQKHAFRYNPEETLFSIFSKIERKRNGVSASTHLFRDFKGNELSMDLTLKELKELEIYLQLKEDIFLENTMNSSMTKSCEITIREEEEPRGEQPTDDVELDLETKSETNSDPKIEITNIEKTQSLKSMQGPRNTEDKSHILSESSSTDKGIEGSRLRTVSKQDVVKYDNVVVHKQTSSSLPVLEEERQTVSLTQLSPNMLSLRDKVAKEIYDSEISYINSLTTLHREWIKPMKEKKLITNEESKELFANIESILDFSRDQLAVDLKKKMDFWHDQQEIGDIFNRLAPFLRLYKTYCDNYENALGMLTKVSKKKNLSAFLKQAEEICNGFSCSYYLIMPVQRVPRYQLLLRELIAKTPETHQDYDQLTKAMNLITVLAGEVNASVLHAEKVRAMGELMTMGNLVGLDELIAPHRHLILRGPATAKSSDGSECKIILLFNDLCALVATSDKVKKEKQIMTIKEKIYLNTAWIMDHSEEWFKIRTPEISNIFVGTKLKDNSDWEEQIIKQIKNWLITPSISKGRDSEEPSLNEKLITEENDKADIRFTQYTFHKDGSCYRGHWLGGQPHGEGRLEIKGVIITGTWSKGYYVQGKAVYPNGDVYEGPWHLYLPHGIGTLTYANGIVYEGEWQNGLQTGQGSLTFPNGSQYKGSFDSNRMHGSGSFHGYQHGSSHSSGKYTELEYLYEGQFERDMRHGFGIFTTKDYSYTGEWRNNVYHGKGKQVTAVATYEGNFVDGCREGEGTCTWTTNDGTECSYSGSWKNNKYNGEGTLTCGNYSYTGGWKNGQKTGEGKEVTLECGIYQGQWSLNFHHGRGRWEHNGEIYNGSWQCGLKHGDGKYTYSNGDVYEGEWEHDIRKGKGVYTWKLTKAYYKGNWDHNFPHGDGELKCPLNNITYDGKWEHGKRTGEGTLKIDAAIYIGSFKNGKKEGKGIEKIDKVTCSGTWKEGLRNGDITLTMEGSTGSLALNYKEGAKPAPQGTYFQVPDPPETPFLDWLDL